MTEPKVEAGDRALETARKDFETWAAQEHCRGIGPLDISPQVDGSAGYDQYDTDLAWESWQACAALIQSAINAQEREIAKLIDLYTGPTGGWLVAPIFLKAEIERLLAERGEGR